MADSPKDDLHFNSPPGDGKGHIYYGLGINKERTEFTPVIGVKCFGVVIEFAANCHCRDEGQAKELLTQIYEIITGPKLLTQKSADGRYVDRDYNPVLTSIKNDSSIN